MKNKDMFAILGMITFVANKTPCLMADLISQTNPCINALGNSLQARLVRLFLPMIVKDCLSASRLGRSGFGARLRNRFSFRCGWSAAQKVIQRDTVTGWVRTGKIC